MRRNPRRCKPRRTASRRWPSTRRWGARGTSCPDVTRRAAGAVVLPIAADTGSERPMGPHGRTTVRCVARASKPPLAIVFADGGGLGARRQVPGGACGAAHAPKLLIGANAVKDPVLLHRRPTICGAARAVVPPVAIGLADGCRGQARPLPSGTHHDARATVDLVRAHAVCKHPMQSVWGPAIRARGARSSTIHMTLVTVLLTIIAGEAWPRSFALTDFLAARGWVVALPLQTWPCYM